MKISIDIAIFGGGIAGLWLLNRLRQQGYNAVLFETNALGCGQTSRSQGIIHGGMKYALQGVLTNDATAMADMPTLWRECLEGVGEINLSQVNILSPQHYLWAANKLTAKLGGFLASAALSSRVASLNKKDYPAVFNNAAFKGDVYALDEMVLDVPALVRVLAKPYADVIFKMDAMREEDLQLDATGKLTYITVRAGEREMQLSAQHVVFTAGEGNEVIIKKLNQPALAMQCRPLHMVMVNSPFQLPPLYAHCMGLGARPRITVTTHYRSDGSAVWYLGGMLAETGVEKNTEQHIQAARAELVSLFPWLDFSTAQFATFIINRAEPLQKSGMKPETSFCSTYGNVTIGWPTKLALAPTLSAEIISQLSVGWVERSLRSPTTEAAQQSSLEGIKSWPHAPFATPIWDEL